MNTLPALPPVVYLAGRYMTSLDMFMAKVRDVLSSMRRNALMEQEHLLALYRDGVLLAWLRTLSSTDNRAGSMAELLEKSMKMQLTDTDAKKYIAKLFGSEVQPVSSLKFNDYVELLPECMVNKDLQKKQKKPYTPNIHDIIDVQDAEQRFVLVLLSFRVIKVANDVIPVTLGESTFNIDLRAKGKVVTEMFHVILSDEGDFTANLTAGNSVIHTFSFNRGWVDLGFGVKWGTCNVGAKHPWEKGDYFAWGEIVTKDSYTWSNYLKPDLENIAGRSSNDCAKAIMGKKWKIPTKNQFMKLFESCEREYIEIEGERCVKLISRVNGKYIILQTYYCDPSDKGTAYGKLWSATGYTFYKAFGVKNCILAIEEYDKEIGMPVRPIYIG